MRSMIVGLGLFISSAATFAADNSGTDASTGAPDGGAGGTSSSPLAVTGAASDAPEEDALLKELEQQTQLFQKRNALLEEQRKFETSQLEALKARYPVAPVADLRKGDATSYEQTSFLANWALSANLEYLVPLASDLDKVCSQERPTLVAGDDANYASKILAAKVIDESITAMLKQAQSWDTAAIAEAKANQASGKKDGRDSGKGGPSRESGIIQAFSIAQSLTTQTIDMLKYFRTDIEFKAATVSLPTQTLRSAVASHCPGSRLPELAIPKDSALLRNYATLVMLAESIRARTREGSSTTMRPALNAEGLSLVASIDAIKAQAVPTGQNQVSPIVEAAQLLSHSDIKQILTVRINDQGATVYKRSNLFFLSPKISYVAAVGVNYVISTADTGQVTWQKTMLLKTQLNQSFSRWSSDVIGEGVGSEGKGQDPLHRTTTILE